MCVTVPMDQEEMEEEEMKVTLAGMQEEIMAPSQIEEGAMATILRMEVVAQGVGEVTIGGQTVMVVVEPAQMMVLHAAGPGIKLQG